MADAASGIEHELAVPWFPQRPRHLPGVLAGRRNTHFCMRRTDLEPRIFHIDPDNRSRCGLGATRSRERTFIRSSKAKLSA
ncbi:hypothetical protein D3C84_986200 [compost metagenome]